MIVRNEALNCHAQVGREENFLEVERKIQHYLAATLLPQILVQEEPSHPQGLPCFRSAHSSHVLSPLQSLLASPAAGTILCVPQPPDCNLGAKLLLGRSKGAAAAAPLSYKWPLWQLIALPIISIVLSVLEPSLDDQFNLQTSCWN